MHVKVFTFDTDYLPCKYYTHRCCSLVLTTLLRHTTKVYFSSGASAPPRCDILVVDAANAKAPQAQSLAGVRRCAIYTDRPFASLLKYIKIRDAIKYRCVIFDLSDTYIILNAENFDGALGDVIAGLWAAVADRCGMSGGASRLAVGGLRSLSDAKARGNADGRRDAKNRFKSITLASSAVESRHGYTEREDCYDPKRRMPSLNEAEALLSGAIEPAGFVDSVYRLNKKIVRSADRSVVAFRPDAFRKSGSAVEGKKSSVRRVESISCMPEGSKFYYKSLSPARAGRPTGGLVTMQPVAVSSVSRTSSRASRIAYSSSLAAPAARPSEMERSAVFGRTLSYFDPKGCQAQSRLIVRSNPSKTLSQLRIAQQPRVVPAPVPHAARPMIFEKCRACMYGMANQFQIYDPHMHSLTK
ncbi:hypothetical protein PAPHI01_0870 [Pancytospora philotis]|nr:hypothetical protein PAPHI01_0870 [Pancytospora philotis]